MTRPDHRFRCGNCNHRLGRRTGAALAIEIEGARVVATREGVIVECPRCHAGRTWRPPAPIRPPGRRRATITIG